MAANETIITRASAGNALSGDQVIFVCHKDGHTGLSWNYLLIIQQTINQEPGFQKLFLTSIIKLTKPDQDNVIISLTQIFFMAMSVDSRH